LPESLRVHPVGHDPEAFDEACGAPEGGERFAVGGGMEELEARFDKNLAPRSS